MSSQLEVTRKPEGGRPVLLCVPGTYCSPEIFDLFDVALLPDLQIVPISWMTSPGPWDIPTLGRRVASLIRELNIGPVMIAGHSTGGPIALVAALTEPSLVEGLLLVDTGANTEGHGDITSIIKAIEVGTGPEFFERLLRRSFYYQPDQALIQRLSGYADRVPREAALEVLKSQSSVDLAEDLPKLNMPAVVVHGKHDQARTLAHAELLVHHLPHAELRLLDSGHTPMVEVPEAYVEAVRRLYDLTR
ncbi:alpha/beta fold hydrolase [Ktedonospora formicarum]|uniref:Alpha/beta hydrolase n=1 Tax=Ktedonospora formicarum TaxID=2778364 RepID=A0A8J3IDT2_9CHLR|nr:alpha/beta hydrolase [Ktedonospora formicarum]GHO49479.1 alpha/beta hydrolase [Ktedonospora formicarum]